MKAFLGFKEKCEIDFEKLYEDRIFLITGATGAGKTSIFDGICYALYGEASGNERDKANCYRCHLSPDSEEMEVTLSFSVKGTVYHVRRVENSKGVKKIHFYREDDAEHVMTKIKEANAEIATILGLTLEQFKKIVMIPQGEFREFLASGTQEKSDILKKLFSTEIYQKMQDIIKSRYDLSKTMNKTYIDRFLDTMKECDLEDQDIEKGNALLVARLEEALVAQKACEDRVKLRETELKNAELVVTLAEENNRSFEEYVRVRDAYLSLLDREREYQEKRDELKLIRSAESITPKETDAKRKQEELERVLSDSVALGTRKKGLKEKGLALKETLMAIRPDFESLDGKKLERNGLSSLLEKAGRVRTYRETLAKRKEAQQQLTQRIDGFQKAEARIQVLTAEETEKKDVLFGLQLDVSRMTTEKAGLEARRQVLITAYKRNDTREKLGEKVARSERDLGTLTDLLSKKEGIYRIHSEARNQSYSSILRAELASGEPCPVCGSLEHPVTASEHVEFREDGFKAAEEELLRARQDHTTKVAELAGEKRNLTDLLAEIAQFNAENGLETTDTGVIRAMGTAVKTEIEALAEKSGEASKAIAALKSELEMNRKQQSDLKDSLLQAEQVRKDLEQVKNDMMQLEADIRALQDDGAVWAEGDLKRQIEALDAFIQATTSTYAETDRSYQDVQRQESLLEGMESALLERESSLRVEAETLRSLFGQKLLDAGFTEERYVQLKGRISLIPEMEKEIASYADALSSRRGAYEHLKTRGETLVYMEVVPLQEIVYGIRGSLQADRVAYDEGRIGCHHLGLAVERTEDLLRKYAENRESYTILQKLYTTASVGMSFETFVQSYYFEGILLRANERLRKMTDSRFQLKRRNDTESRREKRGLDLNIYDAHSGRERNVLSLSGGESFKASLSLALGLSDFIESSKGSVNLETIFIDEGFGSLDQDSLENALGCLMDLNVSGRIVGIISHVSELKDRIPRKINVRTVPGRGSVAEIN
jgi:exonuclease SbcC